jgi:hypothetical protein
MASKQQTGMSAPRGEVVYAGVDFRCPSCGMTCGWNEKRQVFDAVEVPHPERPDWRQYAHERCADVLRD